MRLTNLYLKRLQEFDPKLHCVITLTPEFDLKQAKQADEEIACGQPYTADRCTAGDSRGAAKICSTRREFQPRMGQSRSATACPAKMLPS